MSDDSLKVFSNEELDRVHAWKVAELIHQAKLANQYAARIAELESLLTQAACDKIEETAFQAMKERVEAIEGALEWAYNAGEYINLSYGSLRLFEDARDVEDCRCRCRVDVNPNATNIGAELADALIALSKEQGNG